MPRLFFITDQAPSGWWSGLSGCGHAIRGQAGRRMRCGHGNSPQMAVVRRIPEAARRIPEAALWASFPEVNRSAVLGLLSMLLERLAVPAGASEGAGDEHGTPA